MATLIALLLVLCTLTACAGGSVTDVKNSPPVVEEPPQVTVEEVIAYEVELRENGDAVRSEDGVLLVEYAYQVPVLWAVRADGSRIEEPQTPAEVEALTVTDTFNAEFADWNGSEYIQGIIGFAEEDRKFREEAGIPWDDTSAYTDGLRCQVYQTEQLISISGLYSTYTGGAHPNYVLLSWNFDLTTGAYFAPEALAADSQEFSDLVTQEIIRQARERAAEQQLLPEECFWENYEEIAASWGSYAVSFDETGMTVGYSPYEMAAYAAGAQIFTLEYDLLQPALSDHGIEVLQLEKAAE
ncbi:MAG: DUF3298 and DUF4163 domain-containing protein [Oscillibacter sp.]|nr:DUF3298 and DUF4163 domain-containing protein [Oscillibacter sp.]